MGVRASAPDVEAAAAAQGSLPPLPPSLAAEAAMHAQAPLQEVNLWWRIFAAHTSSAAGAAAVARLLQPAGDGTPPVTGPGVDDDGDDDDNDSTAATTPVGAVGKMGRRPQAIRMDRAAFLSIPEFEFHPLGTRIFDVACTFMPCLDEKPVLSFPQFCTLLQIFSLDGGFIEKSKFAFELMDVNGDGFVVPDEMQAYLRAISSASDDMIANATDKVFAECASHPGKISISDFRNVVSLSDGFETNFSVLPKVRTIKHILQHRVRETKRRAEVEARAAAAAAAAAASAKSPKKTADLEEGQLDLSGLVKQHQRLRGLAIKARTAVSQKQTRTDAPPSLMPPPVVQLHTVAEKTSTDP